MVIILVRRFVRPDREERFLASYRDQAPIDDAAFLGETLTRLNDSGELSADMKSFPLATPGCVTYVNIAKWRSWRAFENHFSAVPYTFDAEIETAPAQQAVMEIVERSPAGEPASR
jgi:hypothetical protein